MNHASDVIDVSKDVVPIHRQFSGAAAAKNVTVAQIALAWLITEPWGIITLIGAKGIEQLNHNLGAIGVVFGDDELELLDKTSKLPSEVSSQMNNYISAHQAKGGSSLQLLVWREWTGVKCGAEILEIVCGRGGAAKFYPRRSSVAPFSIRVN
jgi:Aldo/keto reductase family